MMKKLFTFLLALVTSVGMMNAKVTWNSSNISDLNVYATYESYSKEGVTLRGNADQIRAEWYNFGDESMDGIEFRADEPGGYTFSNTLGKNFTKIEMTLTSPGSWDSANLGSGWSFSWDFMNDKPATVTWTGNASTVDLLKEASNFHGGGSVKSIVFYFEGDSEAPDPTYTIALKAGTANADKVTLSATSAVEGATVTVTPNEDYEITAFSAYYVVVEDQLGSIYEIDATLNAETGAYSFTMPAYDVTIEATIALKPVPEGDVFAGFTATAGSGGFDNEGHANLVDNKFISSNWTKWCTNDGHKSVPTGESESCWWIDFEASAALNLTGYILTTGNDTGSEHGRNPKNWVLKAKLNADDAWTTIATVTNDVTMKNKSFKDYKFFVDQSGSYKYFRFEVFANQGASVMQLCELRLIGTESTPEPTPTVWTALKVGDVIKVGDKIEVPAEGDGSWGINGNVLRNAWGPYTLIRADIYQASEFDDPVVTEDANGAFYVFKAENSNFYPLSNIAKGGALVVTGTSDGLEVTAAENKEFTVAVHDGGGTPTVAECGLVWLGVPEGGVVGTIGHEDEVQLPQLYATNPDFINALMGGSATVRLGSTDESVLKVLGFNNFQAIAAGECDVFAVHDADATFAYDSVAFHVTIKPAEEPATGYAEIIFLEAVGKDDLAADASFGLLGTDFSVAITDTDNKMSIDANSCRFGGEEDYKSYSFRLKSGGKSSSKNFITLNIPAAGKLRLAVRSGNNDATDRNLVITQGEKELYNAVIQESMAIEVTEGETQVKVYPYVEVAVAAGTVRLTYPVNGLNFYSFGFMEVSTPTGVEQLQGDNAQTTKVIRDGQLLIIRDGKTYNVVGATVR